MEPALVVACETGRIDEVRVLLDTGADINYSDGLPLSAASAEGHADIVRLLLAREACVNAHRGGALRRACERGHLEIVEILIEAKADIHADNGFTFVSACDQGSLSVVKLLVANGALDDPPPDPFLNLLYGRPIKYDLKNALYCASNGGHIDIVRLLIQKKPDISKKEAFGNAVFRGNADIVNLLLAAGANVSWLECINPVSVGINMYSSATRTVRSVLVAGLSPDQVSPNFYTSPARTLLGLRYKAKNIPEAQLEELEKYRKVIADTLPRELVDIALEYV